MNRQIVFVGQVPLDTDILDTNLNAYIGIAKISAAILGISTQLNGLACTQNGTPDLTVLVAPGEIYQLANIDTTAYGSLPINTTQILKQGINLAQTHVTGFVAPVTVGQSINYLIQCELAEVDDGDLVLPYYNSANPSQAFAGPNNSGQPQFTNRGDYVSLTIKPGTAAATGTQTTPSPDAGHVGAWVVTIAQGQTTITNSDISLYPSAPFISSSGSGIVPSIQNSSYTYAAAAGSANTYTVSLSPAITSYVTGLHFYTKISATNTAASTINVNGLGAKTIKLEDGSDTYAGILQINAIAELFYDGTNMQLLNPAVGANYLFNYAADTGSANAYAVALVPSPAAYGTGMWVRMKAANTNTTASTLNVNTLGAKNIKLTDGSDPYAGAIKSGGDYLFMYDGTNMQLINPTASAAIQNSSYTYAASASAANTYAVTLTPAPTAYVAGMIVESVITNANTGASTLNVNSLGVRNINLLNGNALIGGEITAGQSCVFMYDGTQFRLLNRANVNGRFLNLQVFPASATYTPTLGTRTAYVEVWGAGAGGGGTTSASIQGGGGGGGAYSAGYVAISGTVSVTIGAGGNGAAANSTSTGSVGNDSSFGASIVAKGGSGGVGGASGGNGGAGGAAASGTGAIKFDGGRGGFTNNVMTLTGQGGCSPKNTPTPATGAAGTSGLANSGQGGQGGTSGATAGTGGSGYCVVTEYG